MPYLIALTLILCAILPIGYAGFAYYADNYIERYIRVAQATLTLFIFSLLGYALAQPALY